MIKLRKKREMMKEAMNPRWLLRRGMLEMFSPIKTSIKISNNYPSCVRDSTDQRPALCTVLTCILKLRKPLNTSAQTYSIFLDPAGLYPQDPVEVERMRNKNIKLKPSTLKVYIE
jgi:hypothetical protein